ncbi:MAG: 50S ribosomal protein L13 [Candidatus Komeilibacteria bacterium]|nr:50S ribosomal protein L13 [Candidatus Komeilibacteria bacterium]
MTINRKTHVIDATDQIGGRLASEVAMLLMGKKKVTYEPRQDHGDLVTITNVAKLKFTGNKLVNKQYYKHSGYLGSTRATSLGHLMDKKPDFLFKKMVRNMLPNNKLRANRLKRLTFK